MSRSVPFYSEDHCDLCGALGAYDFMGDCLCPDCAAECLRDAENAEEGA